MKIVAIAILFMVTTGLAHADSYVIPLPGLIGGYEADAFSEPNPGYPQMRTVDLTIPADVTAIEQLDLVVSGNWHTGEITCDDGMGPETSPFYAGFGMFIQSDAFPGDYFRASISPQDGAFIDQRGDVSSCCPPDVLDLSALIGADLHIEFFVDWALIGICWITDDSYGGISDVRLEIVGTVGTESGTWSSVKSLYR